MYKRCASPEFLLKDFNFNIFRCVCAVPSMNLMYEKKEQIGKCKGYVTLTYCSIFIKLFKVLFWIIDTVNFLSIADLLFRFRNINVIISYGKVLNKELRFVGKMVESCNFNQHTP